MSVMFGSHSVEVWLAEFEKLELQLGEFNSAPILNKVANRIRRDIREHFDEMMGPSGPWAPRKDNLPHSILWKTGALRNAAGVKGAAGNITEVGDDFLIMGVDDSVVEYASFHQYGTSKMVARPFLWVSDLAEEEVGELIGDEVEELLFG